MVVDEIDIWFRIYLSSSTYLILFWACFSCMNSIPYNSSADLTPVFMLYIQTPDWRPLAHFPMDPTNAISAIPCGESIHVFDSTEGSVALVSKIKALSSIEIAARISHRYPTGHIHTAASAAEQVTVDGLVVPAQQAQQAMGAVSAPAVEALAEAGVILQRPPHELLHRLAQRCSTLPSPLPP